MEEQASLSITEPSIAKSASIATIGKSWGKVGPTGAASFVLPLPISSGRGWDPQLSLSYSSQSGNGMFGLCWQVDLPAITRQTTKGVPRYLGDDVFLNTAGEELMPERDDEGNIKARDVSEYRGQTIGNHKVVRYRPRVEQTFELIEFWYSDVTPEGFWLVHGADGSLHLFGKDHSSRVADPQAPLRVAAWLLQESMNAHGEHICYEYLSEEQNELPDPHDYRAQRYLHRVLYGNVDASDQLYGWSVLRPAPPVWLFHLVFDYGERTLELAEKPVYDGATLKPWLVRNDPFSSYGRGFEVGTRRLCRQVLMFHNFPELGDKPVLVRRLLLEYSGNTGLWSYSQITAAHYQAYDASGAVETMPPMEFDYSAFELNTQPVPFFPFDTQPGIEDGQFYQCVDLFGEGLPGFLCRYDQCWYYREPLRDQAGGGGDRISYGPWTALEKIPVADRNKQVHQALIDLTGNGRLDWVIAQPGMCGCFTLNPDRTWSDFIPFTAFALEFFHALSQLGDFNGDGLSSLAMIGPNAVRLYANQRDRFASPEEVTHEPLDDRLPSFSDSRSELVLLGNLLGNDMTDLCRIRHDEIKCWPNHGHGTFGTGFVIKGPTFDYATFDAARVRIADVNGSGAPALIYLNSDDFCIYLNQGGNGFATDPITVLWPEGVRYDNLCQVSLADLQGLGCASLILTVPHMKPRHWRYDFVGAKPYLMIASNNNMGCRTEVVYRSSAQEWLDEKQGILDLNQHAVSYLPFALQVVSQQTQLDEITGNCLNQSFSYFEAWYDNQDREFRGFGRLHQTDSETASDEDESFTEPALVCTWFHTGKQIDMSCTGYFDHDDEAHPLGETLFCRYHPSDECEELIEPADEAMAHAIARALAGSVLRVETYAANDPTTPYLVEQSRYIVRQVRERGEHHPDAVLMVSLLETITYNYERFIDDPLCRHVINLKRDEIGLTTYSITVSYARRRTKEDEPPFTDVDEGTWWIDAHDRAQQFYYLSETRASFIHLLDPQGWRLGLPYQQRGNALVLPKKSEAGGLDPKEICYGQFLELFASAEWAAVRELTSQSVQRYVTTTNDELPDGDAQFEALAGPMEIAQLDKKALEVYDDVTPAIDIRAELEKIGYLSMKLFLGTDEEADKEEDKQKNLWSALYNFAEYAGLERFYRVMEYNETRSHGVTKATYDAYCLAPLSVEQPDGCTTRVEYDYHSLRALRIFDANDNVEEALYDPSGPHTVTYHGTENGVPAGFLPIDKYNRPEDASPDTAIKYPEEALQNAASTFRKDLFSWMGQLQGSMGQTSEWLGDWITQGYVLPSLHLRASARLRLARLKSRTPAEQALWDLLVSVPRIPVHSVALSADRDFYDEEPPKIQIALSLVDGFGRPLQTQQQVEPGDAYVVEKGKLAIVNGKPTVAHAERRWRISERVEYNNKGLPVRTYRPYFANAYGYINDDCLKEFGHHDKSFYDVLGRLIKVINAKGDIALEKIHPWYTTKLDFNDTYVAPDTKEFKADKQ
ncbi:SpvB/TcaC N-terminal domain-containing protein [Pseudomonas sp. FP1742]|uniref:SpvB/TcaC N-terminal domain-containing protein n=1 Tax=Pseudomonas sp. FP1742 TaxID=2954079 RepID=UPI0027342A8C|nr:SpvB/TcaC N-terminal domain-containing protein [Pseudomonas sp. FP1742]WLG49724.1 SpvB/TcaC N-terminal domain-containing protein [Pseudomonas sp. FP1742]